METNRIIKIATFMIILCVFSFAGFTQDQSEDDSYGRQMLRKSQRFSERTQHRMERWRRVDCLAYLPDLNDEQKEAVKKLRIDMLKNVKDLLDQLEIEQANLHAMSGKDNPDMEALMKKVEEIGLLKTALAKEKVIHRLEVRELLTEDQRIIFDSHRRHRHKRH